MQRWLMGAHGQTTKCVGNRGLGGVRPIALLFQACRMRERRERLRVSCPSDRAVIGLFPQAPPGALRHDTMVLYSLVRPTRK